MKKKLLSLILCLSAYNGYANFSASEVLEMNQIFQKGNSWYRDVEKIGGKEESYVKLPVKPDGNCLFHALGITPDLNFYTKFAEAIFSIKNEKIRLNTFFSIMGNKFSEVCSELSNEERNNVKNNVRNGQLEETQTFIKYFLERKKTAHWKDVTLNMGDSNTVECLQKVLDRAIEPIFMNNQENFNALHFSNNKAMKLILHHNHWCPVFAYNEEIPLRFLESALQAQNNNTFVCTTKYNQLKKILLERNESVSLHSAEMIDLRGEELPEIPAPSDQNNASNVIDLRGEELPEIPAPSYKNKTSNVIHLRSEELPKIPAPSYKNKTSNVIHLRSKETLFTTVTKKIEYIVSWVKSAIRAIIN